MTIHSLGLTVLLSLASFLITPLASARVFSVNEEQRVSRRAEEIKSIITDTENTCARSCRYHVSNVREMKVVERVSDNHYYTWVYVQSVRSTKEFFEVTIRTDPSGAIIIKSVTPSQQKIRQLRERTGLPYQTIMDRAEATWVLQEKYDRQGNFLYTLTSYTNKVWSNSPLLRFFGGRIRSEMRKSALDMFENLKR